MERSRRSPPRIVAVIAAAAGRRWAGRATGVGARCTLLWSLGMGCVIPISPPIESQPDGGSPDQLADAGLGVGHPGEGGSAPLDSGSGGSPPPGSWVNVTNNLANMASQCGNMSSVFAKPDEDLLIAGIALDGLWSSNNGGMTWQPMGAGSGSAVITNRPSSLAYDPTTPGRFWESGLYNSGGVYETTDDGNTFAQLGNVTHCDLVSVDFSDPSRQTILAGGHDQSQTLYRSTDGGMTWNNVGGGLPVNTNCTVPLVIDSQTHLVGCAGYGGGAVGVYRTTDGGATWGVATTSGGSSAPLRASDQSIYWASPGGQGMTRSTDNGQDWTDVTGSGVINGVSPVELPDGRIATLGPNYVMISADHGITWKPASAMLPYSDAVGVVYSSQQLAFYTWHFTCGFNGPVPVPSDAVMKFAFDYETN